MIPQTAPSGTTARFSIDIRRFPWLKRLATDYAFDYARLASFFAGNPADASAWREAIARAQRHPRERDAVAALIDAQQRGRAAPPEAVAAAARLRDPATVAVVTGQQAGLFGGPLFTLLKAITAIGLAERVAAEHHVPAVAVFWVDAEDHDWDEVRTCGLLDADLRPAHVEIGTPPAAGQGPVAGVRLDETATAAIAALAATVQATEFTPRLLETLSRTYRPGAGMAAAFAAWLESVLGPHGLIVFDASDPAAKPMASAVFAGEVERAGQTSALAAAAGARLEAQGYHIQVAPQDGHLALFHLDGSRDGIVRQGEAFQIGERTESADALLARVRTSPGAFSPNVLLRPIVQDTLFPTCCYVAGPNELGYLAQLGGVYAAFGVPMPLVHLRATATLLDSNAMRFLARHELPLEALRAQDEAALNQLLESQLPASVDACLEDATRALTDRMDALTTAVGQIDVTLEGAARSTSGRMQDELKKLHAKIIQAAKRKDETLRRQFQHARAQSFPGGHPQEREVGFVYFLNKYGDTLVERLREELPLDLGHHWVLTI